MLLHIVVLFVNMVLIINLLIAFMSDTYARLSQVRVGLYWSSVIKEMPKYAYDKHYGVLVMFPFVFSFVGFLILPCFAMIKDMKKLEAINEWAFKLFYVPIAVLVLPIFMAVNLALLPIAYFKTILHKVIVFKKYKGAEHTKNLLVFTFLGLPFLVISQFTDVYYFLMHTFRAKQQ